MKGSLTVIGIALLCFLIGIGASALMSTPAQASDGGPSPCSTLCGYEIVCGPDPVCALTSESMHYRCKQWNPPLWDCSGPWTCGCVALGCGGNCNIE
jgi:hypothetical protein